MIINNKATEIGDVLTIKTDVPILGIIALQSFIDTTVGENSDRYFTKKFRYSVDGINYSPWTLLTDANLQQVVVQSNDTFYAEYTYTRAGIDASGDLEFTSVTIQGEYDPPSTGPVFANSNFAQFFDQNNVCSIAWSVNVLEKLYKKGILPKYIERNFSGSNTEDRDFLDFWRAITHYFGLFVCLARKYQTFYQNNTLLFEYLIERGLLICITTDQVDLLYLMQNYYDEIRQRGTRQVFKAKSDDKSVDGEFLRLICYEVMDEFVFNLNKKEHIGWNINNSSPMYRGLESRLNMNKYYCDFIDDIYSVNELSIDNASLPYVSIVKDFDLEDESTSVSESDSDSHSSPNSSKKVLQITPPGLGNTAGIGKGDKKIVINPNFDYEITFFVKRDQLSTPTLTFGVDCWDKEGNVIDPLHISTLLPENNFLYQESIDQNDRYYFVRGILYNKYAYQTYVSNYTYKSGVVVLRSGNYYRAKRDVPVNIDPLLYSTYWEFLTASEVADYFKTSLGKGNNLLLQPGIVQIDPYILFDDVNSSVNNIYLYDIRVQILNSPYSKGFVQGGNLLEIWGTNNNQALSETKINNVTKQYLVPANTVVKTNFVDSEINLVI